VFYLPFMGNLNEKLLHAALALLAELIADKPPQHFVVCGGSSLLALDLVNRTTTRDVDVVAKIEDGSLATPRPLPGWLMEAIDQVKVELSLMDGWFNTGPALFEIEFPEGMGARLITRSYGDSLQVSFISRYDQIFFKLHATVDRGIGRHYQDLRDLNPSADELLAAAHWCLTQNVSSDFLIKLKEVLKNLGHESLSKKL
jgi:hypothetical protein